MSKTDVPKDLKLVGAVVAVGLVLTVINAAETWQARSELFLLSLPMCAVGTIVCKLVARKDFRWPKSWPEWILGYMITTIVGGMIFLPFRLLSQ